MSTNSPKKKKNTPSFTSELVMPRYFALVMIFAVIAFAILIRASYLMFVQDDYWMTVSERFKKSHVEIPATRGNIISADGQVLATSLPEYRLYMDFMTYEKKDTAARMRDQLRRDRLLYLKLDSIAQGMHEIFPDINPDDFKKLMLAGRAKRSHHWQLYRPRITYIQYCKVKELPMFRLGANRGGLTVEVFRQRKNPFGQLAHSTIGIYDTERDNLMTGLEKAFDRDLCGTPGAAHRQKMMDHYVTIIDTAALDGNDVYTTLDVSMQDLVEKTLGDQLKALDAKVGMCILMDVKTGDVKAISSLTKIRDGVYREVDSRALYSRREPGSVFKPVSFMAAFEDGKIDLNSSVNVGGGVREMYKRKMRDSNWRKGGWNCALSAVDIIKHSSNVGVSVLIDNAYHAHPEQFVQSVRRTGIATNLQLPLDAYRPPNIRMPQKDSHGYWKNWSNTALPWMSIGYETQIPPIQTLTFYNGIANGGKMVKPRFVTAIKHGDEIVREYPVEYIHKDRKDYMMCSPATLEKVKTCLEAVVGKANCTGKDVYTKKFKIAGKTGTAQIWEGGGNSGSYIISFCGYFPANAPQYSMIVCIEKTFPAYGGSMCGPVFKKIAETIWARNIRADLRTTVDTTAHRHDVPVMRGGNLKALSGVLDDLGVEHEKNYDSDQSLVWGRNTSGTPTSAVLTPDKNSDNTSTEKDEKLTMPEVRGYGLRDALYRLERMGLRVSVKGSGRVVRQSIPAGHTLKANQQVEIILSNDEKYKDPEPEPKPETPTDSAAQKAEQVTATSDTKKI